MTKKKLQITLCLGSSCFSRGNKAIVEVVQEYLEDLDMKDSTTFKGGHCFGNCADGPVMIINGRTFNNITPESAISAVDEVLKSQD
ncbi:MAG TPA: NAD(P)H-dependent oxidoreductase subunit E [Bacteroidales bacterium]|nr:NAD(P)H-dependent oxidoreductase subunit E [Bacteroidales bacterium]